MFDFKRDGVGMEVSLNCSAFDGAYGDRDIRGKINYTDGQGTKEIAYEGSTKTGIQKTGTIPYDKNNLQPRGYVDTILQNPTFTQVGQELFSVLVYHEDNPYEAYVKDSGGKLTLVDGGVKHTTTFLDDTDLDGDGNVTELVSVSGGPNAVLYDKEGNSLTPKFMEAVWSDAKKQINTEESALESAPIPESYSCTGIDQQDGGRVVNGTFNPRRPSPEEEQQGIAAPGRLWIKLPEA